MKARFPIARQRGRARFAGWALGLALSLGLAVSLESAPAHAQSDADRATARALADEGQTALDAGDYAKAVDRFSRADEVFPAPTIKLGLARAQVGAKKLVAGSETYQRIVREGVKPGDPPPFQEAVDTAAKELEQLKPRIPTVVILVDGGSSPEVSVDGAPLSVASLGVRRIIDPGQHVLRASGPGMTPGEKTFTIAEGGSETVQLSLVPGVAPPPPFGGPLPPQPQPEQPPPDDGDGGGSVLVPIGAIVAGVGAAGLVAGGITGILAITKHSELKDDCNDDKECPENSKGTLDDYRTFGDISTVTFIVGGILAAGGITMVIIGSSSGSDTGSAAAPPLVAIEPFVGPTGGGIRGTF